MFNGNFFLYIFLIFMIIFLLRYAYMRYYLRKYQAHLPSSSNSSRVQGNSAAYFIRLRAMQEARLQDRGRQEMMAATDLPPKYEDLGLGQLNYAVDMDMDPPGYSECVGNWSQNAQVVVKDLTVEEHVDAGDNARPGRF